MILSTFERVGLAYTSKEQVIDGEWPLIAQLLLDLHITDNKQSVRLFNLWEFDQNGEQGRKYVYKNKLRTEEFTYIPGTIRRCKTNALHLWGIVLDYDGDRRIEEVIEELDGFEFVLYTTFRHTHETHRFRVVLPFKTAVTSAIVLEKQEALKEVFPNVDNSSFNMSHSFYFHSAPSNDAFSCWCTGEFMDLSVFRSTELPVYTAPSSSSSASTYYQEKLVESLMTCSGLHYNGNGTKHHVLTLVSLCRSAELTFEEYDYICQHIMAADSSLATPSIRHVAWIGWKGDRVTKATRDEFLREHNGISKFEDQKTLLKKSIKGYYI